MLVLLRQESQRKSEGASEDQRKSLTIYESQIKINETQRIIDASERTLTIIIGLRHDNARSNREVHSPEAKFWKITWNRRKATWAQFAAWLVISMKIDEHQFANTHIN